MAREVRVAILGDSRDFARAVKNVQGDANKLDRAFTGIRSGAAKMGKAVALGAGALAVGGVALAKGFIEAANESAKVTAQTEAVLKSMGNQAGVTAKQVSKLSTKLSMQSGIDDELIQSGSNLLLTFGKIQNRVGKGNKIFDRATQAALDMSVALGTDMKSASIQVGKALNDPVKGVTALTRAGVSFTQKQKDTIKQLVETGDTLGAQKLILSELDKQFAGSAAAQATSADKLRVAWGNIQEQLGERLLPVFNDIADWLAAKLPAAIDAASPFLETAFSLITSVGEAVGKVVAEKLTQLRSWWDENGPAVTEMVEGFANDFNDYVLQPMKDVVDYLGATFGPKIGQIATWFATNKGAAEALAGVVGGLLIVAFAAWAGAAVKAAIASAVAWGVALLPVTLFLLVIGLVIAALWVAYQLLHDKFSWVPGFFEALWGWAKLFADALWSAVQWAGELLEKLTRIKELNPLAGLGNDQFGNDSGSPIPDALDIIGGALKKLPFFDHGGVMPGPRGQHSLAMVAGGETILPTHRGGGGSQTNVYITTAADPRAVVEAVSRYVKSNGQPAWNRS